MQTSDKNILPKYNSVETIPARVFFEVLQSKDYQQLKPKPNTKNLDLVFSAIHDEWFIRSENTEAKQFMELSNNINFINFKIQSIEQIMLYLFNNYRLYSLQNEEVKKLKNDILDALEEKCDLSINRDNLLLDEIGRIMQIEIGILRNDLTEYTIEYESLTKSHVKKAFDFYDGIISLSNAHGRNIDESLSLAYYIALEKSAIKQSGKQIKK